MRSFARAPWLTANLLCALTLSCTTTPERERLECTLDSAAEICVVHRPETKLCDAYKEYVTTYNYLLNKKDLSLSKDQVSRTAFAVAGACNGAAGRFIRVFELLVRSNVILPEATAIAQELAQGDDESAKTFAEVFRFAFLENYLDLPLPESIRIARSIATDFNGQSALKQNEFKKLVEFCLSKAGLGLSRPDCAKFSGEVISYDVETRSKSVGSSFISFMEFLQADKSGPQLASFDAMQIAKEVMKVHVEGGKNFISAYKFASDKDELALSRSDAIKFAKSLAALSRFSSKPVPPSKPDAKAEARSQATSSKVW